VFVPLNYGSFKSFNNFKILVIYDAVELLPQGAASMRGATFGVAKSTHV
jgi:hypothetical protein